MTPQPLAGIKRAVWTARRSETGAAATAAFDVPHGVPLIVHADDFGETLQITQGILCGLDAGVVTSTSVMVNMPGSADALQRAPFIPRQASIGVHVNLCEGRPLTPARTLVDAAGQFHGKRSLFVRSISGRLALAELEAEIGAQIARVVDAGVRVSHVDGHKHLHQLPVVATAIANVLPRFAIERVRITRLGGLTKVRSASSLVRECLAMKASRKFGAARLRSPVRTLDLQPLLRSSATAARQAMEGNGPVELCCHPGTSEADVQKPGSHRRSAELDYLLSAAFRELLTARRARLVSYWDV